MSPIPCSIETPPSHPLYPVQGYLNMFPQYHIQPASDSFSLFCEESRLKRRTVIHILSGLDSNTAANVRWLLNQPALSFLTFPH